MYRAVTDFMASITGIIPLFIRNNFLKYLSI